MSGNNPEGLKLTKQLVLLCTSRHGEPQGRPTSPLFPGTHKMCFPLGNPPENRQNPFFFYLMHPKIVV
jgi:hypothetical protein